MNYHIDVTPEEDMLFRETTKQTKAKEGTNIMNIKIIGIVVGVHLIGAVTLMALTPTEKRELPSTAPVVSTVTTTSPVPEQLPIPVVTPLPSLPTSPAKTSPLTTTYTVRKGDTFTKIVKRFKLNPKKLIELNQLKDVNKLYIGQTLKFVK